MSKSVSSSAQAFLLAEFIAYKLKSAKTQKDLSQHVGDIGHNVGLRILEYISSLRKEKTRKITRLDILKYIANEMWMTIFGHQATLYNTEVENSYIIADNLCDYTSNTDRYFVVSYYAGLIEGILDAAEFVTTKVVPIQQEKFSILISFPS